MTFKPIATIIRNGLVLRSMVPAVICLAILTLVLGAERKHSVERRNQDFAATLATFTHGYMDGVWHSLEHFTDDPTPRSLEDMLVVMPMIDRLLQVDADNTVVAAAPPGGKGLDFTIGFDSAAERRLLLSRPLPSPQSGDTSVFIGVRGAGGSTLVAELNLKELAGHIAAMSKTRMGDVILCDAFGNVIIHPDPGMVATHGNIGDSPLFLAATSGMRSCVHDEDGTLYLGAYARVPGTGWFVLVRTGAVDAFAPAIAPVAGATGLMAVVFIALTLSLRRELNNAIARPMAEAVKKLEAIPSLDGYSRRETPVFKELASLEKAVEEMAGRIAGSEARLRESLHEKDVLLREIHHRVKNNLQIISSLLYLQADRVSDKQYLDMFVESRNRISTMALVHEELYRSEGMSRVRIREYVNKLVPRLASAFSCGRNMRCSVDVQDTSLSIEQAIPFGLVLNELVTNSLKHAFVGLDSGIITVFVRRVDGALEAGVSDNGVGLPESFDVQDTPTLGMQLVVQLTRQLRGSLSIGKGPGTSFIVTFPVKEA